MPKEEVTPTNCPVAKYGTALFALVLTSRFNLKFKLDDLSVSSDSWDLVQDCTSKDSVTLKKRNGHQSVQHILHPFIQVGERLHCI